MQMTDAQQISLATTSGAAAFVAWITPYLQLVAVIIAIVSGALVIVDQIQKQIAKRKGK